MNQYTTLGYSLLGNTNLFPNSFYNHLYYSQEHLSLFSTFWLLTKHFDSPAKSSRSLSILSIHAFSSYNSFK